MTRVYCNHPDCEFNKDGNCRTSAISVNLGSCAAMIPRGSYRGTGKGANERRAGGATSKDEHMES